uniref:(California timema) hypothetical protein n=1 Tax=Timema californicum TaxID=61474 RepID=A0A7R9P7A8_TIMCA|nr:unnamed protein product [Timema californicum]
MLSHRERMPVNAPPLVTGRIELARKNTPVDVMKGQKILVFALTFVCCAYLLMPSASAQDSKLRGPGPGSCVVLKRGPVQPRSADNAPASRQGGLPKIKHPIKRYMVISSRVCVSERARPGVVCGVEERTCTAAFS